MKSMTGRFLSRLNFIPSVTAVKQSLVSQYQNLQIPAVCIQDDAGHVAVLKNEELLESELNAGVRENITPSSVKLVPTMDNSEPPISSEITEELETAGEVEEENVEEYPSLASFEEKCPPGGSQSIILYSTSLRSIRKTFEDCQTIRFLLESFKVKYDERDVSMHLEFREELWSILDGRVIPPRIFIRGRYIGGADEMVGLHEQGRLKKLLEGIPPDLSNCPCTGCGNMRFIICCKCNGSAKVSTDVESDYSRVVRCPECNENGLVKCPICN